MKYFTTAKERVDVLNSALEAMKKDVKIKSQEILKKVFLEFFELVPEITVMQWNQYTPYFNDGDACEFSVQELTFFLDDEDLEECEDTWRYSPFGGTYCDVSERVLEKCTKERIAEVQNITEQFEKLFNSFDSEMMLDVFGDHAVITARKSGFDVDTYDHE